MSLAGFSSASINFGLNVAAVGVTLPLQIDGGLVSNSLTNIADGTAAAPSYSFTGDNDTGFYRVSANTLGISTAGVQRVVVDSAGKVQVRGTLEVNSGALEVGLNRVSDGPAYLDFSTTTATSDFNCRIIRDSGANGELRFEQTGTGGTRINGVLRLNSSTSAGFYAVQTIVTTLGSGTTDITAPAGWSSGLGIAQNGDVLTNSFTVTGTVGVSGALRVFHTGGVPGQLCRINIIWLA